MERIPEPELMTDEEQARAYAAADFSAPHEQFVALFRADFPGFSSGTVLDLGCGPGDVTARFARNYPACFLDGVDGAAAMLAEGERMLAGDESLRRRIRLLPGVLPGVVLPRERYDAVISNSLLHHLHDPMVLWETVRRHAAPGAPVFVMDLMRPGSAEDADRLTEIYAAGDPPVLQRDFRNSLLASFTPEEVRVQLEIAGLDGVTVRTVGDRHLLASGRYLGR